MKENNTFEIDRLYGFYGQVTRWGTYSIQNIGPTITAAMGEGGGHVPMVLMIEKDEERN